MHQVFISKCDSYYKLHWYTTVWLWLIETKSSWFNYTSNLEVDGCPSKENLFGKCSLSMNAACIVVP